MTGFNGTPSKRVLDAFGLEPDATGALVPARDNACHSKFGNFPGGFPSEPSIPAESSVLPAEIAAGMRAFFLTPNEVRREEGLPELISISVSAIDAASFASLVDFFNHPSPPFSAFKFTEPPGKDTPKPRSDE